MERAYVPMMEEPDASATRQRARIARRLAVEMIHRSGEGHYGGSLSPIDVLCVLFGGFFDATRGDRTILSKGHGAPGYYAVLAERDVIARSKLHTYGRFGSSLQGHPDMTLEPAIHFSTGSLGQGLSAGLGMAVALRESAAAIWVVLGDGECQEGQVWEAAMLAARLRTSNLIAIVDANKHQEWGFRHEGAASEPVESLSEKWQAFGWQTHEVDGHDHESLWSAFESLTRPRTRPAVLIAHTRKGHGVALIERDPDRFHCGELSAEEFKIVMEQLA